LFIDVEWAWLNYFKDATIMLKKQKIGLLAAAVASIALSGGTGAATQTGNLTVSAVLTSACSVSAAPAISFASFTTLAGVDQTADTGTSLQVACSAGLTPVIYATGTRTMVDGGGLNPIAFNLSLTAGATADDLAIAIGPATSFGLTQDGAAHAVVLYARVPVANFASRTAGAYTTAAPLVVTVSY
jgi:spore coat protein U-like protein